MVALGRPAHAPPRAAGELACRRGRPFNHGRDLLERDAEQIVEHEGDSLGRIQRVEHDEEREADRLGGHGFGFRIARGRRPGDRNGEVRGLFVLRARFARAQVIETHARGHGGQEAAQVRDLIDVGGRHAEPRLLHRIVSLVRRTKQALGDAAKMSAARLERGGEPREILPHIFGHVVRSRSVMSVTGAGARV